MRYAIAHKRCASRVGNVKDVQIAGRLDLRGNLVHGVGRDHEKIGSTRFQALGSIAQTVLCRPNLRCAGAVQSHENQPNAE